MTIIGIEWGLVAQLLPQHPIHTADSDETVSKFRQMLDNRDDDSDYLDTAIMGALIELKANDSINSIRDVFARGKIDREIHGDVKDVEMELGLRTERSSIPDWRFDRHQEKFWKCFWQRVKG